MYYPILTFKQFLEYNVIVILNITELLVIILDYYKQNSIYLLYILETLRNCNIFNCRSFKFLKRCVTHGLDSLTFILSSNVTSGKNRICPDENKVSFFPFHTSILIIELRSSHNEKKNQDRPVFLVPSEQANSYIYLYDAVK